MFFYETVMRHRIWLENNKTRGVRAYFVGADLRGESLAGVDLREADMRWADLREANLRETNLSEANLCGANMRGVNLLGADLSLATLSGANLAGADLTDVNLEGCDLSGANLLGANLTGVCLGLADLTNTVGNMREIKSAQFDTWSCAWTDRVLHVGRMCQELTAWRNVDPAWLEREGGTDMLEWWTKFGGSLMAIIDASPAI